MRLISVTIAVLVVLFMYAQNSWTFEGSGEWQEGDAMLLDVVETGSGYLIGAGNRSGSGSTSAWYGHLLKLDPHGALLTSRRLWNHDDIHYSIVSIQEDLASGDWLVFGHIRDAEGARGIATYRCHADLTPIDSSYHVFPGLGLVSFGNVTRDTDGTYLIAAAGRVSTPLPDRMILMRFGADGDLLDERTFLLTAQPPPIAHPYVIPRHVITMDGGGSLVGCAGDLQDVIPSERSSFHRFDQAFTLQGSFYPPHADGSVDPWGIAEGWKTISEHHFMHRQTNGDLIVSGRRGSLSHGYRAAINRITEDGGWISAFLPESSSWYDYPFMLNSSWQREDGRVLFGMIEAYHTPVAGLPLDPNRIHVWELDTMLNPLCSAQVAHGDELDLYYQPQRIKATSDGGIIVIGGVASLSDPNPIFDYWAVKLGPDDCLTIGMEEHASLSAHLFPNPGTEGFTATLNGPVVHGGTLRLFDAQGRLAGTTPVQQSSARFNAQGLVPGMYFYHISDAHGRPRGSGKWVKE